MRSIEQWVIDAYHRRRLQLFGNNNNPGNDDLDNSDPDIDESLSDQPGDENRDEED